VATELLAGVARNVPAGTDWPAALPIKLGTKTFDLAQTALIVGRRTGCDLVLDTPDVSLTHALIFAHRGRPVVFDLGSRSGTFVDSRRIHQAPLRNGARLTIGGLTFTVECPNVPGANVSHFVPMVAADEIVASPAGTTVRESRAHPRAAGPCPQAVRDDLSALQRQLEHRALELDRRAAELDTLGTLLAIEREHVEQAKLDLKRRAAEIEQAEKAASERLAQAAVHEQAVTAAWDELHRWHDRHAKRIESAAEKAAGARDQSAVIASAQSSAAQAFAPAGASCAGAGASVGHV
jgi:pSer/pThr/pTyr-binding forkhead associated (FHA) protein